MNVSRLFQGTLKHIKSLSKKVCFVVVVVAASRAEGGLVVLQCAAAPKNGVKFCQGTFGVIKSILATLYNVW